MKGTKTLIIEAVPLVRLGLRHLLSVNAGMQVCAEADDVGRAADLFDVHRPDLVVLDINLPGGHAIMFMKSLRRRAPGTAFLVLTVQDDVATMQLALRAGAHGCVGKSDDLHEILEALLMIEQGRRYVSRRLASALVDAMACGGVQAKAGELTLLSDREMQIFRLIGDGLASKEIAHRLHISAKTVETHRQRIKDKLGCGSASQLRHRAEVWHLEHDGRQKPGHRTRVA